MSQPHTTSNPTPTDSSMDQITSQLAMTSIAHEINGQWAYFPPGTSIEEQLLILAGVEDYTLNGSASQVFSAAEMSRLANASSSPGTLRTGEFDAKAAMSQHVDMLQDSELAGLMHTTLRLTASSQTTATPTPPVTGYQLSYPPGSLDDLENMYTQALWQCATPDDLADAPLPMRTEELGGLGTYMVRQMWWMMADGDLRWMVKSPKAHPLYPYWVLPGTGEVYSSEMGGGGRGDEMEM